MGIIVSGENFHRSSYTEVYRSDGTVQRVSADESVYVTTEQPIDDSEMFVDVSFELHKAREDEQLVSGWANVSVNANGSIPLDWSDDVIAPETLEKAAINFMQDYRESGVMHTGESVGTVVESIVFTKEKQEAIGIPEGTVPVGWFITVKVHDKEVFAKVKDGTYKMFSIQGTCRRVQC